jgi:1-aminocyclopropane-1-carboxylate deaminase/D-cysteine desulfhydrase-like pyridoxal-dependent ACC family enzyme
MWTGKRSHVPIEKIQLPDWPDAPEVWVLREDKAHPHYGGNKYWKLRGNIIAMHSEQKKRLVTMGGAYSNHLYATAALCHELEIPCLGLVRGEKPAVLSPTLQFALAQGMSLAFLSREDFRRLREMGTEAIPEIFDKQKDYWIPEGGSNAEGVKSCADWAGTITDDYDLIGIACGSGGSLAGLAGARPNRRFLGISVLKGDFMDATVATLQAEAFGTSSANWQVNTDFHGGGYAKLSPEMRTFMPFFEQHTGIPLDPIYTVKLFFALDRLLQAGALSTSTRILAIHTGGLQGRAGFALTAKAKS